jgi:ABC-type nickel/cobalt efflux system permease component RcnA
MDRSSQLNDYPTDLLNSPPQELDATVAFTTALPAPPIASANGLQASGRNEEAATGKSAPWRKNAGMSSHKADIRESAKPAIGPVVRPGAVASDSSRAHEKNPPRLQANLQETPRNRFTELMAAKQLNLGIALLALVVAVGLGAFHALEPGHGKTLVAAYLVGSRGTAKHALLLGLTVTAVHTAGVYLLGAVTLYASQYIVPERLSPWLGVLSGVLIAGLGGFLLARRYFGEDAIPTHHHHGSHDHNSGHGHFHGHHPHDHDRAHSHGADPQVSPRELLTLGISGGIIPCPAALVVLLSAVSMQRIGFGLLLIVAFSVGLAAVLITIGLFMVYARHFMSRFQANNRFTTRWLPMTSSAFIFSFGIAHTQQAHQTAGIVTTHR